MIKGYFICTGTVLVLGWVSLIDQFMETSELFPVGGKGEDTDFRKELLGNKPVNY